jgi:hypothetical protein
MYVGDHARQLESGQPVVFGDVLDSLSPADELALERWLVPADAPPAPEPAPEPDSATPTPSEVT